MKNVIDLRMETERFQRYIDTLKSDLDFHLLQLSEAIKEENKEEQNEIKFKLSCIVAELEKYGKLN